MSKIKYISIIILLSISSLAHSITVSYNSQLDFFNALPGTAQTIDFDAYVAGSILPSGANIDGAVINYSISGGAEIMVDNVFDTTSPNNYLGLNDGTGAFLGGDAVTFSFTQAQTAVGLYVMSADLIFANDFMLTTNTGLSVTNSDLSDQTLIDGEAYYLGLIESDISLAFNSITLSSLAADYSFNVDDVTVSAVPLPAAAWLFISGLIGLVKLASMRTSMRNRLSME